MIVEYVPVSPENNTAASHACLKTSNYYCKRLNLQMQEETLGLCCFQRLPKFAPSQLLSVIASTCVAASV